MRRQYLEGAAVTAAGKKDGVELPADHTPSLGVDQLPGRLMLVASTTPSA